MIKGIITEDKKKNNGRRKTSLKTNNWSTRTQLNTRLNCLHILIIFLHVDLDRTRWRLFQKRVACTKLDIYFLFITMSGSIPLLVGYIYYYERLDTSAGGLYLLLWVARYLCWWAIFITISGSIPLLVGYIYYYQWLDTSAGGLCLLLSVARYLCWWAICPRGYHRSSHQCIGYGLLDIFDYLQFLNNLIISIARVLLHQAYVTLSDIDYPGYSRTLIEFCTNP